MKYKLLKYTAITFLFLGLVISLGSCKKLREKWFKTKIEGSLIVEQTGEPLTDIKIVLERCIYCENPRITEIVDSFYTDNAGEFYYEFEADVDYTYWFSFDLPCFKFDNDNYSHYLYKGKKNKFDFKPIMLGSVIYHFVNTSPYDENDYLVFTLPSGNILERYGMEIDLSNTISYNAFTEYTYQYTVTKNNITQDYSGSFNIDTPCARDTIQIYY